MELIPEVLPIKDLESYFRARIRSANATVNESRIVSGLRKTIDIGQEVKLRIGDGLPGSRGGRNRRVIITEERICGVCHKRFGGSAIKVLPKWVIVYRPQLSTLIESCSDTVIHYGCSVR